MKTKTKAMKLDPTHFLPETLGIATVTVLGISLGSFVAAIQNRLPWDFLLSDITVLLALVILWLFSKVVCEILIILRQINQKLK